MAEPTVKLVVLNESGQEMEEFSSEYTFGHISQAIDFYEAGEVLLDAEYEAGGGEVEEDEEEEEVAE